ncbi:hypothetical protein PAMA_001475 [Pampus argenteus]
MQPMPFRAECQAVVERKVKERRGEERRGEERRGEERRGEERRGEERRGEHAVSLTPEVPGGSQLSVPYLQKALFRDSPNEHSCPHSAPQWSPPLPLSLLTIENIAPIKPRDNKLGKKQLGAHSQRIPNPYPPPGTWSVLFLDGVATDLVLSSSLVPVASQGFLQPSRHRTAEGLRRSGGGGGLEE